MEWTCESCRFWDPHGQGRKDSDTGDCRKNAPIPNTFGDTISVYLSQISLMLYDVYTKVAAEERTLEEVNKFSDDMSAHEGLQHATWPVVFNFDWCGDWKAEKESA